MLIIFWLLKIKGTAVKRNMIADCDFASSVQIIISKFQLGEVWDGLLRKEFGMA